MALVRARKKLQREDDEGKSDANKDVAVAVVSTAARRATEQIPDPSGTDLDRMNPINFMTRRSEVDLKTNDPYQTRFERAAGCGIRTGQLRLDGVVCLDMSKPGVNYLSQGCTDPYALAVHENDTGCSPIDYKRPTPGNGTITVHAMDLKVEIPVLFLDKALRAALPNHRAVQSFAQGGPRKTFKGLP